MAKFVVLLNIRGLPAMMTRPDSPDPMLYEDIHNAVKAGDIKNMQVDSIHGFQVIGWPYTEDDHCCIKRSERTDGVIDGF